MNLFDRLAHDHKTILDVCDSFERYLAEPDADAHEMPRFLVFFREVADGNHHGLEETVLMPALARHGFPIAVGPSAFIREQHDRERDLLFDLMRLGLAKDVAAPRSPELASAAAKLIAFQRAHIKKETELFFPEARRQLAMEGPTLQKALAHFDASHDAAGRGVWLEHLTAELLMSHPAPRAASDTR